MKIVIDAGHGQQTQGKRCLKSLDAKETREWWLNDRVADKVEKLLKGYKNCGVLRADDTTGKIDVALETRAKKANNYNADFYLSIHHNAGVNGGTGGGIMAFSYPNSKEGADWRNAFYDELIKQTGLKGNRSQPKTTADYYVLRKTTMPAVLLELGFMDSKTDVPIILSESYADKCAKAIVNVIVERGKLAKEAKKESEYKEAVQKRFGFSNGTMSYLEKYEFADELLKRLATAK